MNESRRPKIAVLASAISAVLGTTTTTAFAQEEALEEITVTGSRIVRRDLTSSSPIVTVDSAALENTSSVGIENTLNAMPMFVAGDTQFDTSQTEPSAFTTPGIATLNLRGLGPNRNLVLVNGRRAQPANALLLVDVNSIPAAAVERVETITGGASAVYGADALAGVVNFILKNDFEGVSLDFQTGQTAEGDGFESKFSTLIGMNSGDGRGNVMFGVDWTKRGLVYQRDRDWFTAGWFDEGSISGGFVDSPGWRANANIDARFPELVALTGRLPNRPSQAAVDAVFSQYDPNYVPGQVHNRNEFFWNPDGSPFLQSGAYNYTGPLMYNTVDGQGFTGIKRRPDGNLETYDTELLMSYPLDRRSAFGRATYDINDNLTAFAQANYSAVNTRQVSGYIPAITVWQAVIPRDGRAIPDDLATLLDSRPYPDDPWVMYRGLDFLGPERSDNQTDMYQTMFGVEGNIAANDWTYEAYVSTGRTTNLFLGKYGSTQRYRTLVAASDWGQGGFVFGSGYELHCDTGLPMFGGPLPSANCIEAIQAKLKVLTQIEQDIAEANLQGRLADMRAGELRFALGVSGRRNSFKFEPSEINDDISVIEQPQGIFVSNDSIGSTEVKELYGELLVPVTQNLELELGYRYSDYDTAGSVDTWKALFSYDASASVRLRGGFQFATRAPNVAELFTGPAVDVVAFPLGDPCAYTTLASWGNVPSNPNRLQVQELCVAIIGNTTSDFGAPGSPQADNHARPGSPFFPLEIETVRGNPNLLSEEASTWTFGLVLNGPGNLENFVASFDIYNVEIEGAISPLDSSFVYAQCFNANGTSNPNYDYDDPGGWCGIITRNEINGERSRVEAPFFNAGVLETTGMDVAVNWGKEMGPGSFNLNSIVTILDRFETQDNPSADIFDAAGTLDQGGQFDYRLVTTLNYAWGDTQLGVQWRHYPSIADETAARDPSTRILGVDSYNLFNLFARHQINDRIEFRGGVDNLFDEEPPVVSADPGTTGTPADRNLGDTESAFYDVLGRRYYIGFQMNF